MPHKLLTIDERLATDGIVVIDNIMSLPLEDKPYVCPHLIIAICHSGSIDFLIDSRPDTFSAHEVSVIFPNHPLEYVNVTPDYNATLIAISSSLLSEPMMQTIQQSRKRYESRAGFKLADEQYSILMRVVDLMHISIDTIETRLLHARLLETFILLLNHYRKTSINDLQDLSLLSVRFQQVLDAHVLQHRDIAFYADLLCISPKRFSSVIKQETGFTPSHLIRRALAYQAKMMLRTRLDLSVQEIAYALGFDEQQAFSRFFKRETGVTPSAYRQSL